MRLVLTHSGMHSAPKRQARYTPMPATPPGLSFLCFERTRTVKTLRFAPARSLIYFASVCHSFIASLLPSTSSASLNPTATPPAITTVFVTTDHVTKTAMPFHSPTAPTLLCSFVLTDHSYYISLFLYRPLAILVLYWSLTKSFHRKACFVAL